MIKKIHKELLILGILVVGILFTHNIDIDLYNFFNNFNDPLKNIYLKKSGKKKSISTVKWTPEKKYRFRNSELLGSGKQAFHLWNKPWVNRITFF